MPPNCFLEENLVDFHHPCFLAPVNVIDQHWILLWADLTSGATCLVDPLEANSTPDHEQLLRRLLPRLQTWADLSGFVFPLHQTNPPPHQLQPNSHDCGAFVAVYAERIAGNLPLALISTEEICDVRIRMHAHLETPPGTPALLDELPPDTMELPLPAALDQSPVPPDWSPPPHPVAAVVETQPSLTDPVGEDGALHGPQSCCEFWSARFDACASLEDLERDIGELSSAWLDRTRRHLKEQDPGPTRVARPQQGQTRRPPFMVPPVYV
ncbi:PREDICTED: uncharacterized protein LOC106811105 [Priapulus caudatus]|uniref:Uncharacterized protein LOC106811105 n=1 Tax=Priapulus caudatus TaxID=37621 RepID=A0ABM1ED53_PRICU|nr:PREDICTED: uncharacterized protein LOC106811105 [Priapulus caudatus]